MTHHVDDLATARRMMTQGFVLYVLPGRCYLRRAHGVHYVTRAVADDLINWPMTYRAGVQGARQEYRHRGCFAPGVVQARITHNRRPEAA